MVDFRVIYLKLYISGSVRKVVTQPHHELSSDAYSSTADSSMTSFYTSSKAFRGLERLWLNETCMLF